MALVKSQFRVNKVIRLYNDISTRIEKLDMQKKFFKDRVSLSQKSNQKCLDCNRDIDQLEKLKARLVQYSLIRNKAYPEVYKQFKKYPKNIEEHTKMLFDNYVPYTNKELNNLKRCEKSYQKALENGDNNAILTKKCEYEDSLLVYEYMQRFKKRVEESKKEVRVSELKKRIRLECELRLKQGWFLVFNTLTVTDWNMQKVFGPDANAWEKYIKALEREIGYSKYPNKTVREIKELSDGRPFHRYFAVVERGKETGRLHIHALHFIKDLPRGCSDPNKGRNIPNYKEISYLKKLWEYGYSTPEPVRISNSDAYAKLGWRFPVEKTEDGHKTIRCGSTEGVVSYIAKYITKEYNKKQNGETKWRTRMSRTLGLDPIIQIIKKANKQEILLMTALPKCKQMKMLQKSLPFNLIKREATKQLLKNYKKLKNKKIFELIIGIKPAESIYEHTRNMLKTNWAYSPSNYASSQILRLKDMVISKLLEKIREVELIMFGDRLINYNGRGMSIQC